MQGNLEGKEFGHGLHAAILVLQTGLEVVRKSRGGRWGSECDCMLELKSGDKYMERNDWKERRSLFMHLLRGVDIIIMFEL